MKEFQTKFNQYFCIVTELAERAEKVVKNLLADVSTAEIVDNVEAIVVRRIDSFSGVVFQESIEYINLVDGNILVHFEDGITSKWDSILNEDKIIIAQTMINMLEDDEYFFEDNECSDNMPF